VLLRIVARHCPLELGVSVNELPGAEGRNPHRTVREDLKPRVLLGAACQLLELPADRPGGLVLAADQVKSPEAEQHLGQTRRRADALA
jgi:hypothetical protein